MPLVVTRKIYHQPGASVTYQLLLFHRNNSVGFPKRKNKEDNTCKCSLPTLGFSLSVFP